MLLNQVLSDARLSSDQLINHRRTLQLLLWFATIFRLIIACGIARRKSLRHRCWPAVFEFMPSCSLSNLSSQAVLLYIIIFWMYDRILCCFLQPSRILVLLIDESGNKRHRSWQALLPSWQALLPSWQALPPSWKALPPLGHALLPLWQALLPCIAASSATLHRSKLCHRHCKLCHHHGKHCHRALPVRFH